MKGCSEGENIQIMRCADEQSLPDWHPDMVDIDPVQATVGSELVSAMRKGVVVIEMEGQR